MISILILNGKAQETEVFRKYFGELVAFGSDERLEWKALKNSTEMVPVIESGAVVHMAILDVSVKGALQSAAQLREQHSETEIMILADLTISPMEYMNPAIRASSLLLRPFTRELMEKTSKTFFSNSMQLQTDESGGKNFLVENSDGKTPLPYSGIFYFEAREKKIFVRTASDEYAIYDTIENLQTKLPDQFIRCHRSFIVNGALIDRIRFSENIIYLEREMCVPLSRSYKNTLKEYVNGAEES